MQPLMALGRISVALCFACPTNWWVSCSICQGKVQIIVFCIFLLVKKFYELFVTFVHQGLAEYVLKATPTVTKNGIIGFDARHNSQR